MDTFANTSGGITGPAINAEAVTPSGAELAAVSRAISVAASGDVTVTMLGGQAITIYIAAGIPFPIRVTHITAATATGIVVYW